ncbi:acyltransferase domain-containing protein, partial [Streptomyces sp. SM12]|uniref:acyltransferase domain-containing protein n=1 Tax=Streptomyces sp. SM12 TaxID=1071602 RepID=UPI0011B0BF3C
DGAGGTDGAGGRAVTLADLTALAAGRPSPATTTGTTRPGARTVFVFPGQGAQWAGMARQLAGQSPVFARRLAECGRALAPHTDWDLDDVVHGRPGAPGLERVDVVQPTLFAVMVSLAALWQELGVRPDAVLGHSQGEIAAACVSGALTLEDAARVVALRSRALTALAGTGGMLSVQVSADEAAARLTGHGDRAAVAAVNGPRSVVLAGEPGALDTLAEAFAADGARVKRVPVDYASHTRAVEHIRAAIERDLAPVTGHAPHIPMLSALTGNWVEDGELDGGYWYSSLRGTVSFRSATETLLADGPVTFVEISPHPVLLPAVGETADGTGGEAALVPTLRRDDGGWDRFLTAAAQAHVAGVPVDWTAVLGTEPGPRVQLDNYPFQHRRYWAEQPAADAAPETGAPGDDRQREFWEHVREGDADGLAARLGLAADATALAALRGLLPALDSWRATGEDAARADTLRYRTEWRPVPGTARPAPSPGGRWLLAVPEAPTDDVVRAVRELLTASGTEVVEVPVPDEATRDQLAAQLGEPSEHADGVLSLLALREAAGDPGDAGGSYGDDGSDALTATLRLLQALGDDGRPHPPVWLVTRGAVAVAPGEAVPHPGQAALWGLARVIAAELPEAHGGVIDLPAAHHAPENPAPGALDEETGRRLLAVLAGHTGEDEIALRPDRSWTRRLRH